VLSVDDSWLAKEHYRALNNSITEPLNVTISVSPITLGWWRFSMQMDNAFGVIGVVMGEDEGGSEAEQMKQLFADTNPYLLLVTMFVSVIHLVFDFLGIHYPHTILVTIERIHLTNRFPL
jgi:UDP-N-acetylglucosamine:LPS N-acetylglucosamine transferase